MEVCSARCPLIVSSCVQRFGSALSVVDVASRNLSGRPTRVLRGSFGGTGTTALP